MAGLRTRRHRGRGPQQPVRATAHPGRRHGRAQRLLLEAEAFDDVACALGESFAGYAAVAVANAQLVADTSTLARQMQEAMASRAVIEQARGVLMAQRGCSPEEAFSTMSRASRTSNRKLRDIAAAIVDGVRRQ